jgi:hypothetical protein
MQQISRLERIIQIHFDVDRGTPYWLEKQNELGIDVTEHIRSIEDLSILGPMDEDALARRPVEDFVPRMWRQPSLTGLPGNSPARQPAGGDYLLAETAGTTNRPKFAIHRADEFEAAFVTPFVKAAERVSFPKHGHWLFVGPTGPHIIGRAARQCARALGAPDVFTVDFDPRWAKKLPAGSFAALRYLQHIEAQALHVLEVQNIEILFATPAVLSSLAEKMDGAKRQAIRGIHLGGMSASAGFMDKMNRLFHNAVILSGYGNTLFGMMPQLHYERDTGFDYFAYGDRLAVRLVPIPQDDGEPDITMRVEYGQRGRVMVHRLDEMQFLANVLERDTAIRVKPDSDAVADGFFQDGIRDPQPIVSDVLKPVIGLY